MAITQGGSCRVRSIRLPGCAHVVKEPSFARRLAPIQLQRRAVLPLSSKSRLRRNLWQCRVFPSARRQLHPSTLRPPLRTGFRRQAGSQLLDKSSMETCLHSKGCHLLKNASSFQNASFSPERRPWMESRQPKWLRSGRMLARIASGDQAGRSPRAAKVDESPSTSGREGLDGSLLTGDGSYLKDTRELVEVAMLAATGGLAYVLSNLLRLEGYFATFFPLPLVVAAIRGDLRAAGKTMVATTLLLLVLSGPLRALLYLISYGSLGLAMGAGWRLRIRWLKSVLLISLVRVASLIASLIISSWLLRENIPRLIITQFHASLTVMFHSVGLPSGPGVGTVIGLASFALFFNSVSYVFLLHILYSILLRRLGLQTASAAPAWVVKAGQTPRRRR